MSGSKDLMQPFRVAWNGLVYTFRTQRHMRFHLYVVAIVLLLGLLLNLGLREVMVLLKPNELLEKWVGHKLRKDEATRIAVKQDLDNLLSKFDY